MKRLTFYLLATLAVHSFAQTAQEYFASGIRKYSTKEHKAAIEDYDKAIALEPNNGDFYYWRGLAKAYSGSNGSALRDYKKAIKKKSKYSDTAYYIMAHYEIYMLEHGYRGTGVLGHRHAIKNFNAAIKLNPKYATAYYEAGMAKASIQVEDYKGAIEYFTKVIELSPELAPNAYYRRGDCKNATKGMQLKGIDPGGACSDWKKAESLGCKFVKRPCN
ncbi:MAG TPA: tetratricopeptide repeat protein [Bacteroidia bacterium]|nr:tetratricopeptide repeat protein [Bacteroidia bacterium]